jgi:hypothetical protein
MRIRLGMYPTRLGSNPYGLFGSRRRALAFLGELSRELLRVKPGYERVNSRTFESDVYEYDRGVYVVDVRGVEGRVSSDEDLLTSYWWALFLGLIRDVDVGDCVATDGTAYILRSSAHVNAGGAYISYGTGTAPESFVDNRLVARAGSISTSVTIAYLSDRVRVSFSGTLPSGASELGIEQSLYDTTGGSRTTLLGRKVGSFSAGQGVVWNIDFLSPWVRAVGDFMYGIHMDLNVTMVRIDGVSFTARTSGTAGPSSAYLVASSGVMTWDPMLYGITGAFSLTNFYADVLGSRFVRSTIIYGLSSPASDISVNTIGLYFRVYDSAGTAQTVCVLVQPLASPITLYARRNNLIVLRIIAL